MSIVQNYYDFQKFNMSEIVNSKNGGEIKAEREVFGTASTTHHSVVSQLATGVLHGLRPY